MKYFLNKNNKNILYVLLLSISLWILAICIKFSDYKLSIIFLVSFLITLISANVLLILLNIFKNNHKNIHKNICSLTTLLDNFSLAGMCIVSIILIFFVITQFLEIRNNDLWIKWIVIFTIFQILYIIYIENKYYDWIAHKFKKNESNKHVILKFILSTGVIYLSSPTFFLLVIFVIIRFLL